MKTFLFAAVVMLSLAGHAQTYAYDQKAYVPSNAPAVAPQVASGAVTTEQAITNLFRARMVAFESSVDLEISDGRLIRFTVHPGTFCNRLSAIDSSGCPNDVRVAWMAYQQAWRRKLRLQKQAGQDLILGVAASALTSGVGGILAGAHGAIQSSEKGDTHDAYDNLCLAAMAHGIDATRIKLTP